MEESIQESLKPPGQKMLEWFWVEFFINDNGLNEHNLKKKMNEHLFFSVINKLVK